MRTNALHIVNQGKAFDVIFQMFKPFLNQRMKSKIFIHGTDYTSLHKHIHPEHLPRRYGGTLPEYPYGEWMVNLVKNEKIINEMKQLGYVFDVDKDIKM